jgi:hypothetical protein
MIKMEKTMKIFKYLFWLFFISLIIATCTLVKERNSLLGNLSNYQMREKAFKLELRKDSSTIATQSQTLLSQKEAERLKILVLEDKMKKVQSQVTTKTTTGLNDVVVGWAGVIDDTTTNSTIEHDTLVVADTNCLKIPKRFEVKEKFYQISGEVIRQGIRFDSIAFPNETIVTVGERKQNLFSKKESVVQIKNTNPYVKMQSMNNIVIKPKKPFYEHPVFLIGVGVIGAKLLTK